jgi:hypothetical protein
MRLLLITVALGPRRRDLAVRADVPIADLLGPLVDALDGALPLLVGSEARHGVGLGLAPLCGSALPLERSLEACGIGHGAVLVLIGSVSEGGRGVGLMETPDRGRS